LGVGRKLQIDAAPVSKFLATDKIIVYARNMDYKTSGLTS